MNLGKMRKSVRGEWSDNEKIGLIHFQAGKI